MFLWKGTPWNAKGFPFFKKQIVLRRYPGKGRGCRLLRSEIVSQEKNVTRILVEVEEGTFRKKIDEAVENLRVKANIKGFRKGHVPRKVLELHLGADAIRAEALEQLVPEMLDKVVKEYELDLISEPSVEVDNLEKDKPVKMTFVFETRPEVVLPDLETIEVTRKKVVLTGKMLDEAITSLRNNVSEKIPVEGRPSRTGDLLDVEYSVKIQDPEEKEVMKELPKQRSLVELDPDQLPEDLSAALQGRTAGDSFEVDVTTKAEDASEERILRYSIDILSVSEKRLPEMDGVFFEKVVGDPGLTEEDFREKIHARLQENLAEESLKDAERKAISLIIERSELDLPESLVERQRTIIREDMAERIKKETEMTLDDYLKEKSIDKDQFEAGLLSDAEASVRRSLVMEALADREMIEVENADVDREIAELSRSMGVEETRVRNFFLKNTDTLADIVHRIRMKKTVSRVMEKVSIKEDDISEETSETAKNEEEGS